MGWRNVSPIRRLQMKKLLSYEEALKTIDYTTECSKLAEQMKPYVVNYTINKIVSYCQGDTRVKFWIRGGCPWDRSGEVLSTNEFLTMNNTVAEVLENYTGNSFATYCAGCGLSFENISDILNSRLFEIRSLLSNHLLEQYLIKNNIEIDEDAVADVCDQHSLEFYDSIDDIEKEFTSEEEFLYEKIYGFDVDITVEEFAKNIVELPKNELWEQILQQIE